MNRSVSIIKAVNELLEAIAGSVNVRTDSSQTAAQKHFSSNVPAPIQKEPDFNTSDHALTGGNAGMNHRSLDNAHSFLKTNATNVGSYKSSSGFNVDHYQHGGNNFLVQYEPDINHTNMISSTSDGMNHLNSSMNAAKSDDTYKPPSITMRNSPVDKSTDNYFSSRPRYS